MAVFSFNMLTVGVVESTSVTKNKNKSTYAHKLIASYEVAGWFTKEMELTGHGRRGCRSIANVFIQ